MEPLGKRKRSEEGLGLGGLLGAYASEEEEEELEGPFKAQRTTLEGGCMCRGATSKQGAEGQKPELLETERVAVAVASPAQSDEGSVGGIHVALEAAAQKAEPTPQKAGPADSKTEDADDGEANDVSEGVQGRELVDDPPEELQLPPELAEPPSQPCPPELQKKISDFLHKQQSKGITISETLRRHRGYRNPDFLELCVKHHKLTECTSCYPKDIFDPTDLPPEDYYDRLAAEWQAMQDKRTAERQATGHIPFAKGPTEVAGRPAYAPAAQGGVAGIAAKLVGQVKAASAGGGRSSKWDTKR